MAAAPLLNGCNVTLPLDMTELNSWNAPHSEFNSKLILTS
jgi:hypothetical protein